MRPRPHLINVLKSLNSKTVGVDTVGACSAAAICLTHNMHPTRSTINSLGTLSRKHPSPHVREIAGEALNYLRGLK